MRARLLSSAIFPRRRRRRTRRGSSNAAPVPSKIKHSVSIISRDYSTGEEGREEGYRGVGGKFRRGAKGIRSLLGVLRLRHRLNEVFEVSKWEELSMTRKSRLYFSSALQPRNSSRLFLLSLSRSVRFNLRSFNWAGW